jgi:hypothetical protein
MVEIAPQVWQWPFRSPPIMEMLNPSAALLSFLVVMSNLSTLGARPSYH